jgi:hypothetical protein
VAAVFALVAAACGDDAEVTTTTAAPVAPPETEARQAPTTTAVATTSTQATTTTTTAAPTTTEAPALPAQAELTHGGEAVGVYLQVIEEADSSGDFRADFAAVVDDVEAMGYFGGFGDLNCDQGAQEALGLGAGQWYGASLYFETEADAELFVAAYPGEVVGIATVFTYCVD